MTVISTIEELDDLELGTPLQCADGQVRRVVDSSSGRALQGFDGAIAVLRPRLIQLLPARTLHAQGAGGSPDGEQIERAIRFAHSMACARHAAGSDGEERTWLDMLILLERTAATEPAHGDLIAELRWWQEAFPRDVPSYKLIGRTLDALQSSSVQVTT